MPSDFGSLLASTLAEAAPSAQATAPDTTPPDAQATEATQAEDNTGEAAPQQDEEQDQGEQGEDTEEQPDAEQEPGGGGDLKKALASERYKARQHREQAQAAQAQLAAAQAQLAQFQQLQAQVQALQAERSKADSLSAQQEAQARAQELMERGDVEGVAEVWRDFALKKETDAKAAFENQARELQAQAQHQMTLANITAAAGRLQAQHGPAYTDTMAWFQAPDSKAAPVAHMCGEALLAGQMTADQVYDLAAALKRGMALSEDAIEAEVQKRLAKAQVNGPQAQHRSPRLSGLPGGTGNTSQTPAHTGNPQALQRVERGSGFGAYLGAALQA